MGRSPINDSKAYPCPACGSDPAAECWPREPEDINWVHTERRVVLQMNINRARAQHMGINAPW